MSKNAVQIICALIGAAAVVIAAIIGVNNSKLKDELGSANASIAALQSQMQATTAGNAGFVNDTGSGYVPAAQTEKSTTTQAPQPKVQYLTDLAPAFKLDSCEEFTAESGRSFSMSGTKYYNGYTWGTTWMESSLPLVIVPLNGRFTEVSGIIGCIDRNESRNIDASMHIFFDGVLQEHLTKPLYGEMIPEEFTIPVAGVQHLKMQLIRDSIFADYGYANITVK